MSPTLLSVEVIVESLDRALEILVDVLGCELIDRRPSQAPAGELALVDLGSVVLSVLEPATSGPGQLVGMDQPRVSQFVLSIGGNGSADVKARCAAAGLALSELSDESWFVKPEAVAGALGMKVALVVVPPPQQ